MLGDGVGVGDMCCLQSRELEEGQREAWGKLWRSCGLADAGGICGRWICFSGKRGVECGDDGEQPDDCVWVWAWCEQVQQQGSGRRDRG